MCGSVQWILRAIIGKECGGQGFHWAWGRTGRRLDLQKGVRLVGVFTHEYSERVALGILLMWPSVMRIPVLMERCILRVFTWLIIDR